MQKYHMIPILLLSIWVISCSDQTEKTQASEQVESLEPHINLPALEGDFKAWWTYQTLHISLSSPFIGLNERSDTIEKKQFLEQLTTQAYIPLKLTSDQGVEVYQLGKLTAKADERIGPTIKNEARTYLTYYNMEGSPFPEFAFTDLKGNLHTNENTQGKTIIFKTWFITCKACVAEFPELNELVKRYHQSDDILFVSLALNSDSELKKFLQKKPFEYKVVPDQRDFIDQELGFQAYPTHVVVDKQGIIRKIVNKASEMIAYIEHDMKQEK